MPLSSIVRISGHIIAFQEYLSTNQAVGSSNLSGRAKKDKGPPCGALFLFQLWITFELQSSILGAKRRQADRREAHLSGRAIKTKGRNLHSPSYACDVARPATRSATVTSQQPGGPGVELH